ncbi:unannotated protein [freshwater metagenome]|uniref:Unannotated protein n=1 Tax=freshwater metagenome TaxID=449393 RepID=A0A6J7IHP4_9ZZZZ
MLRARNLRCYFNVDSICQRDGVGDEQRRRENIVLGLADEIGGYMPRNRVLIGEGLLVVVDDMDPSKERLD